MSSTTDSEPPTSDRAETEESSPKPPDAGNGAGFAASSAEGAPVRQSDRDPDPLPSAPASGRSGLGASDSDGPPGADPGGTGPRADRTEAPAAGRGPPSGRTRALVWSTVAVVGLGTIILVRAKDPGPSVDENSYRQIASALEARARPDDARKVVEKCSSSSDCDCVVTTATLALDRDLHAEALPLIERSLSACGERVAGLHAEALARSGKVDRARETATTVLRTRPKDPYATYALAQVAYIAGDTAQARARAQAAVEQGRGAAGNLLLGLIAFNAGDMGSATAAFNKMLQDDPDNVEAHYNLAVVAQRLSQYRNAREGYLKVLQLYPQHLDARYNLALLTHSVGATPEARHHLQKLREVAPPGDQRVARLEAAFSTAPPASSGLTFTRGTVRAPTPARGDP